MLILKNPRISKTIYLLEENVDNPKGVAQVSRDSNTHPRKRQRSTNFFHENGRGFSYNGWFFLCFCLPTKAINSIPFVRSSSFALTKKYPDFRLSKGSFRNFDVFDSNSRESCAIVISPKEIIKKNKRNKLWRVDLIALMRLSRFLWIYRATERKHSNAKKKYNNYFQSYAKNSNRKSTFFFNSIKYFTLENFIM